MKLIPRAIEPQVRQRLETQAAVVLLGPRQVGKTTLARRIADERGEGAIYSIWSGPPICAASTMPTPICGRSRASWW